MSTNMLTDALSSPALYMLLQNALGATRSRRVTINEYARISSGDRVIDIGCGPGYITKFLNGNEYVGFDVSEKYIEYAKKVYGSRGKFFCKELTESDLNELGQFDVVLLNGVLHHMDDETARKTLALAYKALRPGGRVITLDPCYISDQTRFSRFVIDNDRGKNVRTEEEYKAIAANSFSEIECFIRKDLLTVPVELIILKLTKRADS